MNNNIKRELCIYRERECVFVFGAYTIVRKGSCLDEMGLCYSCVKGAAALFPSSLPTN